MAPIAGKTGRQNKEWRGAFPRLIDFQP